MQSSREIVIAQNLKNIFNTGSTKEITIHLIKFYMFIIEYLNLSISLTKNFFNYLRNYTSCYQHPSKDNSSPCLNKIFSQPKCFPSN
jgi:hypothetical protein